MNEKIICAAIWYKDINVIRGDIDKSLYLPVNITEGIVFCGHRHCQCLYQMVSLTGKYQSQVGTEVQGFLTNKNRFVNRTDALKIAENANQIIDTEPIMGKQLYSENLY